MSFHLYYFPYYEEDFQIQMLPVDLSCVEILFFYCYSYQWIRIHLAERFFFFLMQVEVLP